MLIFVNWRRATGSRPSKHYRPMDWTVIPRYTEQVTGIFRLIYLNIIIIAIVTITIIIIINLDVFGPRGLGLNCYKSNNGSSLLATIVRPSPCSLDKAHHRAKRRDHGRWSIYIICSFWTLLYCLTILFEWLLFNIVAFWQITTDNSGGYKA